MQVAVALGVVIGHAIVCVIDVTVLMCVAGAVAVDDPDVAAVDDVVVGVLDDVVVVAVHAAARCSYVGTDGAVDVAVTVYGCIVVGVDVCVW